MSNSVLIISFCKLKEMCGSMNGHSVVTEEFNTRKQNLVQWPENTLQQIKRQLSIAKLGQHAHRLKGAEALEQGGEMSAEFIVAGKEGRGVASRGLLSC